jgi:Flp pilus assembly protein TadG
MIPMGHRAIRVSRFRFCTGEMKAMWKHCLKLFLGTYKRDEGNSMIECAIVLPVLLLLFVGAAEVGRMFYTYTTLAKATKVGARYISTSRLATGTATERTTVTNQAKNLVVCGFIDCAGQTAIAPGFTASHVTVTLPTVGASPAFVRVQISGYPFTTGAFNLAGRLGVTNATIYNTTSLTPGTTMRYIPSS